MKNTFAIAGAIALFSTTMLSPAMADAVTGTLSATYYEVLNNGSGAPDFGGSGSPNVAIGSGLVNNRPVVSTSNPGVSMYDHSTGELLWWTSSATVIQTGTGTVSLPYSSTMYAPNSTGTNDANAFETAVLSGTFTLSSAGAVHFTVGSDDDAFVYLNGVLIGQNPGIHATTDVTFTGNANAGVNTLEIFYADRERTGAQLDVSADVALTAAVPEPSTWAMMILGFFGVGSLAYRRNRKQQVLA